MTDKLEPQKVLEAIENCSVEDQQIVLQYAYETIKQLMADAVPVVHGHWVGEDYDGYADGNPVYYTYRCSECGKLFETDDEPLDFDYCPRCGSKMDGKED